MDAPCLTSAIDALPATPGTGIDAGVVATNGLATRDRLRSCIDAKRARAAWVAWHPLRATNDCTSQASLSILLR